MAKSSMYCTRPHLPHNFFFFSSANMSRAIARAFTRNIYLHRGPRIAGIRREPSEVLVLTTGHLYASSADNLKHIKQFLLDKYAIPDEMALQVLTHKSFANGIKPFNEKLLTMGSKLLNLWLAKYVVNQPTQNELAVNGHNLDVLGTPMAKELSGKIALGVFAKTEKLNSVMFWKSYNSELSFEQSGELSVSAQMMYALVGAVTFVHGKKVAEEFVEQKLFGGSLSLETITEQIVQRLASKSAE